MTDITDGYTSGEWANYWDDSANLGERPSLNPFEDDTPIEAQCDLENPEVCESCQ